MQKYKRFVQSSHQPQQVNRLNRQKKIMSNDFSSDHNKTIEECFNLLQDGRPIFFLFYYIRYLLQEYSCYKHILFMIQESPIFIFGDSPKDLVMLSPLSQIREKWASKLGKKIDIKIFFLENLDYFKKVIEGIRDTAAHLQKTTLDQLFNSLKQAEAKSPLNYVVCSKKYAQKNKKIIENNPIWQQLMEEGHIFIVNNQNEIQGRINSIWSTRLAFDLQNNNLALQNNFLRVQDKSWKSSTAFLTLVAMLKSNIPKSFENHLKFIQSIEVLSSQQIEKRFGSIFNAGPQKNIVIKEYVSSRWFYHILNQGMLILHNPAEIFYLQPFIKNMYDIVRSRFKKKIRQIKKKVTYYRRGKWKKISQIKKKVTYYRGGKCNPGQFEYFQKNSGKLIQNMSFWSTSIDKSTAKRFAQNTKQNAIFYLINIDKIQLILADGSQPGFCKLSENTFQSQVLFNPLTIFQIVKVYEKGQYEDVQFRVVKLKYRSRKSVISDKENGNCILIQKQNKDMKSINCQGDAFYWQEEQPLKGAKQYWQKYAEGDKLTGLEKLKVYYWEVQQSDFQKKLENLENAIRKAKNILNELGNIESQLKKKSLRYENQFDILQIKLLILEKNIAYFSENEILKDFQKLEKDLKNDEKFKCVLEDSKNFLQKQILQVKKTYESFMVSYLYFYQKHNEKVLKHTKSYLQAIEATQPYTYALNNDYLKFELLLPITQYNVKRQKDEATKKLKKLQKKYQNIFGKENIYCKYIEGQLLELSKAT